MSTIHTYIADPANAESVPSAPIAWNGLVFIGTAGSDRYETNLFYDGTVDWCTTVALDASELAKKPGQSWTGAQLADQFGRKDLNWSGWVTATDADTGRVRWRFHASAPVVSGITPTKGGLVFAGDLDKHAYAFDADSGKILWQTEMAGAPGGGVISYLIEGKQRVAFVAGTRTTVLPVSPANTRPPLVGVMPETTGAPA